MTFRPPRICSLLNLRKRMILTKQSFEGDSRRPQETLCLQLLSALPELRRDIGWNLGIHRSPPSAVLEIIRMRLAFLLEFRKLAQPNH